MQEVDTTAPAATGNLVDEISKGLAGKGKKEVVTELVQSLATDIEAGKKEDKTETVTKVEPTAKVEETKKDDTNPEFEALATFLDDKEEDVKPKTEGVIIGDGSTPKEKTTEKDYTEYINKAKEYDETMSIPLVKAFADLVKSGVTNPNEILAKIGYEDVKKVPARQIMEESLKAEG